jgi:hypothetical protein
MFNVSTQTNKLLFLTKKQEVSSCKLSSDKFQSTNGGITDVITTHVIRAMSLVQMYFEQMS